MREEIDPSAPVGISRAIRASEFENRSFGRRVLAALELEERLYEEVERDPTALPQAFAIVVLAALATGLGYSGLMGVRSIVLGIVTGVATWLLWTAVVWLVGVRVFGQNSSGEELLRTLGFVAAPQLLYALMIVPSQMLRSVIAFVVLIMTLVGFIRATRAALGVDTARGIMIAGLCILVHILLGAFLGFFSLLV